MQANLTWTGKQFEKSIQHSNFVSANTWISSFIVWRKEDSAQQRFPLLAQKRSCLELFTMFLFCRKQEERSNIYLNFLSAPFYLMPYKDVKWAS